MENRFVSAIPTFTSPLFELVESRLAILLNDHRRTDIMRVTDDLKAAGEIIDVDDLVEKLSKQLTTHPLWQQLIRVATIGETYFFRDRSQIDVLWRSVLPRLINQRQGMGYKTLRIWSAGCSTGEEPYSIAMMLRDLIPDIKSWDIRILATDLNNSHLERAQRGLYRTWSFRAETPPECREQWFVEEDGGYRIDSSIRDMVTFAPLNLADAAYIVCGQPVMQMDLILCRNVLIYFDKITVSSIIKRFHSALDTDGWLVLGHSESLHMLGQPFDTHNFEGAALYQKKPPQPFMTWRPVMDEVIDTQPVSKPTLLASRIVPKPSPSTQPPEPVPNPASINTDKLDPWTIAHHAANRENWAEALYWLNEAESEHKMRPEVHYLRGIVELQQNEIEKSLTSLRRAIYCKHDFVLAHFTIGEVFEKLGHLKKAANHWTQAQQILGGLPPEQSIDFSDKLTVEMLITVLEYRLENLFVKPPRHSS